MVNSRVLYLKIEEYMNFFNISLDTYFTISGRKINMMSKTSYSKNKIIQINLFKGSYVIDKSITSYTIRDEEILTIYKETISLIRKYKIENLLFSK